MSCGVPLRGFGAMDRRLRAISPKSLHEWRFRSVLRYGYCLISWVCECCNSGVRYLLVLAMVVFPPKKNGT